MTSPSQANMLANGSSFLSRVGTGDSATSAFPTEEETPYIPHEVSGHTTISKHRSLGHAHSKRRKRHRLLGPKKGLAVHFGHENWNMVLSMMIGIRMSIGRITSEMSRELTPADFIIKEKFSIIPRLANIFDSEVSKRVSMTRFIDYAPMVFQRIR